MSYFASNHFESNYFASNYFTGAQADEGGGGTSAAGTKQRKKGERHEAELAALEAHRAVELPDPAPVAKKYTVEEVGGVQLLQEAQELRLSIRRAQIEFEAKRISEEEYRRVVRQENEALEVIIMALNLDRHVLFSII